MLSRPRSLVAFPVMTAAHLASVFVDLPYVVNHWIFVGVIDVAILLTALALWGRHRFARLTGGELLQVLAPVIRWSVLMMYTFAALAKLNSDFFKPELSAAVSLYGGLSEKLGGILPQETWAFHLVIWGTATLECSLPFLLSIRKTRWLGIALAFSFHFAMGVSGFIPFSGFAVAFLFLFLPEDVPARFSEFRTKMPWLDKSCTAIVRVFGSPVTPITLCLAWFLIACTRTYAWLPPDQVRMAVIRVGQLLFALYYGGVAFFVWKMYGRTLLDPSDQPRPASLKLASIGLAIVPLVVILNALCPYIGLKTESSFTMYSNLQTEGNQWNHLLMPKAMKVFHWQDDLVSIIDSTYPPFEHAAKEGIRLTWFEFHRQTSEADSIAVTYRRGDEIYQVADSKSDPVLSSPPEVYWGKWMWFREVPLPEKNTIRH
ncbi:HTTM domain-containing protein [Bremerella volcania]|uniref:HTTM domain-containing protein n=1 Tax=Bremerella volcania TaxID=2527984 RepID=UPI0013FD01DE|nr:HTTM domain-containing protein [Bremerella volcania]